MTWTNLQQLGFVDTLQLARQRWPNQVTPTYSGATWNDTLLVRGPLLAYLHDATVLTEHAFGPHLPFVATFRVPCQTLARQVWQLPRDFTLLRINKDEIARRYQSPSFESPPDELRFRPTLVMPPPRYLHSSRGAVVLQCLSAGKHRRLSSHAPTCLLIRLVMSLLLM